MGTRTQTGRACASVNLHTLPRSGRSRKIDSPPPVPCYGRNLTMKRFGRLRLWQKSDSRDRASKDSDFDASGLLLSDHGSYHEALVTDEWTHRTLSVHRTVTDPFLLQSKPPSSSRNGSTTSGSLHSRANSTSSYGASSGYGQSVRPGSRPQTSMAGAFNESTYGAPRARSNTTRPRTAMGVRGSPDTGPEVGKQGNGTVPPIAFQKPLVARSGALVNRKLRASSSVPSFPSVSSSSTAGGGMRPPPPPPPPLPQSFNSRQSSLSSLCGRIQNMSICEEIEEDVANDHVKSKRSLVISTPETRLPIPASKTAPRHSITPVKRGGNRERADGR